MTRQDDLSDVYAELKELKRQIRQLATAAPLGNSSITRGGLRVASAEGLTVQAVAGGIAMRVTGTEVVDGTLRVTGTFEIPGQTDLTGDVDITGATQITGPLTIAGATDITGDVELTGDLNVVSTGRVNIGAMILDPSAHGGEINFGSGRKIYVAAGVIGVYNGTDGQMVINSSGASINNGGSVAFRAVDAGPQIGGLPTVNRTTIGNPPIGTVWSDTSGNLFRAV